MGNVISGNAQQGNYIGVDANGTALLCNGSSGVRVEGASTNTLIGTGDAGRIDSNPLYAKHELVFIDQRVEGYRFLVDDLIRQDDGTRDVEVLLLNPFRDGVAQIGQVLQGQHDISAIHIISHGTDGRVQLGSGMLDAKALAQGAGAIARWGQALTPGADLMIYGCDVAATQYGQTLLVALSRLTGADVAASVDTTASSLRGGNWDLEYRIGRIESAIVVSSAAQESWQGLLDVTTGLRGHWKFDADANDFSGNNYHGTLTSGALIDTSAGTNKVGPGKLSLDGVNDYVNLSPHRTNFASLTQGTISAWIRTSTSSTVTFFEVSDLADADSYLALYVYSDGTLTFTVIENGTYRLDVWSNATVNNNAWHHVAVTVGATGNKLYIDGAQVAVAYGTGNASTQRFFNNVTGIDFMGIGIDQNNAGFHGPFPGLVDDVRVYNRALAAADVTELSTLYTISGTVFEDVNYGGGAGRNRAAAAGIVRSGARVELFDAAGAFVTSVTTDGSGNYTIPGLYPGSYTVRGASSSVTSSRTGYVAGLLPVLTYRTDASSSTAVGVTNYVGGHDPATADAGNAAAGWILDTATGVFSGSGSGKSHAFAPVTVAAANVTGVDFGWNFDTIANKNDSGQGSLRQFMINANTLHDDASLAQSGHPASIENAIFMISNGTAAAGLRAANNYFSGGVATIAPTSAMPFIDRNVTIDATTQPGYDGTPSIDLNGALIGGLNDNGFETDGDGLTIRGFVIRNFTGAGIHLSGSDTHTIQSNYIGTNASGTAAQANGMGIYVGSGADSTTIGGSNPSDGNIISGNTTEGIRLENVGSAIIQGNYIGVDATGAGALGNTSHGILINTGASNNTIGGTADSARNIISGNQNGVRIVDSGTYGNVLINNYIGTDRTGTAEVGNDLYGVSIGNGVMVSASVTGTIIRNNILSNNGLWGIRDNSSGASTVNTHNLYYSNSSGTCNYSCFPAGTYNVSGDPKFAGSNDYSLTECTSPAINMACNLGNAGYDTFCDSAADGAQPDMNGATTTGNFNNNAPDMGAYETGDCVPGLTIVKQVWEEGGTAPLGNPTAPVGATLIFLIYVKNTTVGPVTDLRINDDLDEAGFEYIAGSLVRTDAGSPPLDTATDKQIFDATASGTGTDLLDPVDGDVASAQDTADLGTDIDKITIGAVAGQENASLSIDGHETFALRFKVKVK